MSGIDLTRKILRKNPVSRIMIISSYSQPELVMQFYRAGAKGYLEKNCTATEIKEALAQILAGKMYYHPSLQILSPKKGMDKKKKVTDLIEFTTRESDLVRLIAKGFSSQDIATLKELKLKTIETSRSRLFKKVGVRNTAELLDYFYRNGLI
jgi:DNA-binding NarL/FixJ family response regulator